MFTEFKNLINDNSGDKFLILSHPSPDPDALGSTIGLSIFLNSINFDNEIVIPLGIGQESSLNQIYNSLESFPISEDINFSPDLTLLLDTPSIERFSYDKDNLGDIILIDHHEVQDGNFKLKIADSNYTSTAEIVFEIVQSFDKNLKDLKHSSLFFKSLLIGIIGDTSKFRYSNSKTLSIVSKILEISNLKIEEIYEIMEGKDLTRSQRIALLKGSKRLNIHEVNDIIVVTSRVGAHESLLCNQFLSIGADISIVGSETSGKIRISSRAKRKTGINLSDVMKSVSLFFEKNGKVTSGGGHSRAAGMNVKKENLDRVMKRILEEIKNMSKA